MVSGAGLSATLITELDRQIKHHGGEDEDLHYLATHAGSQVFQKFAQDYMSIEKVLLGMVKPDHELVEKMTARHYMNEDVRIQVSLMNVPVELWAVKFLFPINLKQVKRRLRTHGLVHADLQHLILAEAQGRIKPVLEDTGSIVALGTLANDRLGECYAPELHWRDGRINIRRISTTESLDPHDDFFLVTKQPPSIYPTVRRE
jgi:hypothetical protein